VLIVSALDAWATAGVVGGTTARDTRCAEAEVSAGGLSEGRTGAGEERQTLDPQP
jgi:hypothetical protein